MGQAHYGGAYSCCMSLLRTGRPESSFVIDLYVVSAVQIIIDPAVSLGRVHHMDLFYLLCNESVLPDSFSDITA